jgi:hypothetical protein
MKKTKKPQRVSRSAAPRCSVPDPYGDGRCRRMKGHAGYHTHGGLAWAPNKGIDIKDGEQ